MAEDMVPVVGEEAFEGEDLAFARLRAAEAVSVRAKLAERFDQARGGMGGRGSMGGRFSVVLSLDCY